MKTNFILVAMVIAMVMLGTCCKNHRDSEIIDFVNRVSPDATDGSILFAIDSAIVVYDLAPHEIQEVCRSYYVNPDKLKNY